MFLHVDQDALCLVGGKHRVRKAYRENLIGPNGGVGRAAIHDVVEVSALLVPEKSVEAQLSEGGHGAIALLVGLIAKGTSEILHDAERVVPERLNLNGLAATRGHDPIPDFGIHPGQLHPGLTRVQQAAAVNLDAITGTADMPGNDVGEDRVKLVADEIEVSGVGKKCACRF